MHGIKRCSVCEYHEAVDNLSSILGSDSICFHCAENSAERPINIHRETQKAYALPTNSPERLSTIQHLRNVTCWHGPDVGYLDLVKSYERFSNQMPVPLSAEEIEDRAMAKKLANRLHEVREQIEAQQIVRKSKNKLWDAITRWFDELRMAFSDAVDAGL